MPDRVLIVSIFILASCGLAYELIAGALTSYLLGDSVLQFSTIIGCYLFAMGIGAHVSRYVRDEDALARFIDIEFAVGLLGGSAAALLFVSFAWLAAPFRALLYALVLAVGILVGMEIPLVMRMLHRHRASLSDLVSRVLTFDYLGALAVSLLFPLFLAPQLGLTRSGFVFGLANVGVALWAVFCFRGQLPSPSRLVLRGSLVMLVLLLGLAFSDRLTTWGERGMFGDEIVYSTSTPYQRLVITRWKDDLRLYINGNLQFSSRDEHRYHEALVHPALEALPWARNVLVLGGGDGLALREILRYPNVQHVTLVDLDRQMTTLFSTSAELVALNHGSFHDSRVTVINSDAAIWLQNSDQMFDFVVADFPDPSNFSLGKLYSVPFYRALKRHLAANGLAVVQSTSPYFAPHAYWSIDATLKEAGLRTWPYHTYVPSFGEWGFVLASAQLDYHPPERYRLQMTYLDGDTTREMFRFPADMPRPPVQPNYLNNEVLVHYFEDDWQNVIR
jgi:spermidine synthase